ncbi:hypothetical protein [Glycomyces algeriensis]|uniref:Uncharacterized protein n=1 Tax=Glycomyces algeriensis TaxID=256037 RepID=A0A9W6LIL1_9ACTN|nr:hypothetical protein [Glycomyces algeriensis]MDA1368336.1 hypothetical protein [Glycomyces algeriensis]MDR7351777.1 hypothetical protein [Glycomyces algeriensis]GLI44505.1 hypothetical protein GALLR39Z86_43550 [Glycomyces algeriensis]
MLQEQRQAQTAWLAKYRDRYPADPDALDEDGEPLDLLAPPEIVAELEAETDRIREHYTAAYRAHRFQTALIPERGP